MQYTPTPREMTHDEFLAWLAQNYINDGHMRSAHGWFWNLDAWLKKAEKAIPYQR